MLAPEFHTNVFSCQTEDGGVFGKAALGRKLASVVQAGQLEFRKCLNDCHEHDLGFIINRREQDAGLRTLAIQLFAHPRDQFRRDMNRIHIIIVNDGGSHCVTLNFMKWSCNHFAGESRGRLVGDGPRVSRAKRGTGALPAS
jgi:hypothetical protein